MPHNEIVKQNIINTKIDSRRHENKCTPATLLAPVFVFCNWKICNWKELKKYDTKRNVIKKVQSNR